MNKSLESQLNHIALVTSLTTTLYIIFSIINLFIAPESIKAQLITFHILIPLMLFFISLLAYYKKYPKLIIYLLILAPIFATTANIIIGLKLPSYTIYHTEVYLIIFWTFTVSGLELRDAFMSALISSIISSVSAHTVLDLPFNASIMHLFWIVSAFSLGFFGKYLLEKSKQDVLKKQEELTRELENKDVLLRELFHRVKNNLQIVSSLILLQAKRIDDIQAKDILHKTTQRIQTMSHIHEKLFISDDLKDIDLNDYINSLIQNIQNSTSTTNINFNTNCEKIKLSIDKAVPLGLIINELLTNSIKYAFDDKDTNKTINITITIDNEDTLSLEVSDNGVGVDFDMKEQGFGFRLIHTLAVYQLKASVDYTSEDGFTCLIKCKI